MLPVCLVMAMTAFHAMAQEKKGLKNIEEAGEISISLSGHPFYNENLSLPVRDIQVMDYRFDSSKIAYADKRCNGSAYCRVVNPLGWNNSLQNYFAPNLNPRSPYQLLIVIRSFWMQEGIQNELTEKKVIKTEWMSRREAGGYCKAGLDVFIRQGDSCQALFKIDASFLHIINFRPGRLSDWFFLPFDSVARRLSQTDLTTALAGKRKISLQQIRDHYSSRLDIPVLKEPLKQGIFMRFEDFKNNRPLETPFRIQQGKVTDELYMGVKEQESIVTDFWGAYDGKELYIYSGFNIFPAMRQQNSYEIFGSKHVEHVHNAPAAGQLIRVNEMNVYLKILHLDMESGRFF